VGSLGQMMMNARSMNQQPIWDEFPEHGSDFHLNRFIEEIGRAFEGLHEF
jgi:hypothetical protein